MGTKMDYQVVSVGKETIPYRKQFTAEEIEKMQGDHLRALIAADRLAAELKAIKEVKQAEINELIAGANETRIQVNAGHIILIVEAFLIPNHETGMMEYMNSETDEVIFSRRLTPDEKQIRMNSLRVANGE